MADVGDVVEDLTAIAMHRIDHVAHGAQGGDDQRHLLLDRHLQIGHQPGIGLVHDVVDAEGGGLWLQPRFDVLDPLAIALGRALVQRGEGADHPGVARLDHQVRPRDQEHGRRDDRQGQTFLQRGGNGHGHLLGFLSLRLAGYCGGRQSSARRCVERHADREGPVLVAWAETCRIQPAALHDVDAGLSKTEPCCHRWSNLDLRHEREKQGLNRLKSGGREIALHSGRACKVQGRAIVRVKLDLEKNSPASSSGSNPSSCCSKRRIIRAFAGAVGRLTLPGIKTLKRRLKLSRDRMDGVSLVFARCGRIFRRAARA